MTSIRRSAPLLSGLVLLTMASFGCSSSNNTAPIDGGGGHGGGGAGGGQVVDASTDAPGDSAADGPQDGPVFDGFPADAISVDVVATDSADSLTLASPSLAEGATFLAVNTCAGADTSPALTWTAGPAGTMSYAITLTDLSIDAVHWVIWDIPATTTSLPAALPGTSTLTAPAGAKQVHKLEFFGAGGAYRGPCPSGQLHIYQFEVNAVSAATLAGVTTASNTDVVKVAIQAGSLAHGDLSGISSATAPADAGGQ
jgi:Raf kinase inhibitor-like YbhB/YbcL family protein